VQSKSDERQMHFLPVSTVKKVTPFQFLLSKTNIILLHNKILAQESISLNYSKIHFCQYLTGKEGIQQMSQTRVTHEIVYYVALPAAF